MSIRNDMTLPPEVRDASAWYGSDLVGRKDWFERLSKLEIGEIDRTVQMLEQSDLDFASLSRKDVPLPTLARRIENVLKEVLNGRGFVLIRGLPIERWTKRQAAIAFLGIGAHIGKLRMQNAEASSGTTTSASFAWHIEQIGPDAMHELLSGRRGRSPFR